MGLKIKVQQSLGIDPSVHDLNHQCSTTEVCTTSTSPHYTLQVLYMQVALNASVNCRPDSHPLCAVRTQIGVKQILAKHMVTAVAWLSLLCKFCECSAGN